MRLIKFLILSLFCFTSAAQANDNLWLGKHIVDLWLSTPRAMVMFDQEYHPLSNSYSNISNRLTFNASHEDDEPSDSFARDTSAYRKDLVRAGCYYTISLSSTGIIESIQLGKEEYIKSCNALPPPTFTALMQYPALDFAQQQPHMFTVEKIGLDLVLTVLQIRHAQFTESISLEEAKACSQSLDVPLNKALRQSCFMRKVFKPNGTTADISIECDSIGCDW